MPEIRVSDGGGHLYNRFAKFAKISQFERHIGSGLPVHELEVQLRSPKGLMKIPAKHFYRNENVEYSERCQDINHPDFESGRELEKYIDQRYPGKLKAPDEGEFAPL